MVWASGDVVADCNFTYLLSPAILSSKNISVLVVEKVTSSPSGSV